MRVGIFGTGKLGITLARLAIDAGHQVLISGSNNSVETQLSVAALVPGAVLTTHNLVAQNTDFVVLALPLAKHTTIDPEVLTGSLVLDAMNYWPDVDGIRPEFTSGSITTSALVQQYFSKSRVVKALSHMGYHDLADFAQPGSNANRRILAYAGAVGADNQTIAAFIESIGFEPFHLGSLDNGLVLQPGQPLFGANMTLAQFNAHVGGKCLQTE